MTKRIQTIYIFMEQKIAIIVQLDQEIICVVRT